MNKAFVFIDGNNFYFKLKELSLQLGGKFSLLDFDFKKFCEWLVVPDSLSDVVGIAKGQSFGLTKVSGAVRLLRPEEIKTFLPKYFLQ